MAKLTRNDACPCGHGKKVKKCHPEYVGMDSATADWVAEMQFALECQSGYIKPMSVGEYVAWKQTGCPHRVCVYDEDKGGCAAPDCGV